MENITFNKYTQIIPTAPEVVKYFTDNGSTQQEALYWFNYQDRMLWKDKSGKKIMEWQKIAYLRIKDLKGKFINQPVPTKAAAKKDGALIIAENIGTLYQSQTKINPSVYIKVTYELILAYKDKYGITDDIELVRSVSDALAECSDWEYDSLKSYLK